MLLTAQWSRLGKGGPRWGDCKSLVLTVSCSLCSLLPRHKDGISLLSQQGPQPEKSGSETKASSFQIMLEKHPEVGPVALSEPSIGKLFIDMQHQ